VKLHEFASLTRGVSSANQTERSRLLEKRQNGCCPMLEAIVAEAQLSDPEAAKYFVCVKRTTNFAPQYRSDMSASAKGQNG
jgi:hypothetical protein